jgi:small conductance mechanosensitive channel
MEDAGFPVEIDRDGTAMWDHWTAAIAAGAGGLVPMIVGNALKLIGAIGILCAGLWLSGKADRLVVKLIGRAPHIDVMLKSFFGSLARYAVLTMTVLSVLSQFGIQTTSIIAVLGAAGLAVGLALQGTLSNLAAGVMLLIFRPFRIGDRVQVGGMQGSVKALSLFWTELVSDDNVQIIVPNGGVWGQPLKNYSVYPTPAHAAEARFRIGEDAPIDGAVAKVKAIVEQEPHILKDPAPAVLLDRTAAENALEIVVAFSTREGDAALAKSNLIKEAHDALHDPPRRDAA